MVNQEATGAWLSCKMETNWAIAKRRLVSGKKKANKHKPFGPVGLGMTLGLSQGQARFVFGTNPVCRWDNPSFLLILHTGSPVCPWDKPSLSLGQTRGYMKGCTNIYPKHLLSYF